jgi:hypothetical protein
VEAGGGVVAIGGTNGVGVGGVVTGLGGGDVGGGELGGGVVGGGGVVALGLGDSDVDALGDGLVDALGLGETDADAAGDVDGGGVMFGPGRNPTDGSGEKSARSGVGTALGLPEAAAALGPGDADGTTTLSLDFSMTLMSESPLARSVPSAAASTLSELPCFSPGLIDPDWL